MVHRGVGAAHHDAKSYRYKNYRCALGAAISVFLGGRGDGFRLEDPVSV